MKIAIVAARGLGDGLLSLILSHNLQLAGHDVTTFNPHLPQLQEWFKDKTLLPYPPSSDFEKTFCSFDRVLAADYSILSGPTSLSVEVLKQSAFDKRKTHVENNVLICKEKLKLPFYGPENGIGAPAGLVKHKFPQRVVLHTMSSSVDRTWPKEKFLKLCTRLYTLGFQPVIAVSPQERPLWQDIEAHPFILLPAFQNIAETASYIYESGFLIGNDSGLGHLASNLGIGTLSLFTKKRHSLLWRPGWKEGIVLTAFPLIPGSRLKQLTWKKLLTVGQAVRGFKRLSKKEKS